MSQPPVVPSRSPRPIQKQDSVPSPSPDIPKIPPRPTRRNDQSPSQMCNNNVPSALNELPGESKMSVKSSGNAPDRPPSATIPSSEEGVASEKLAGWTLSESRDQCPTETRNVDADLKLHAPRPSLPSPSAEAKIRAVTLTDSPQAAAAGVGSVVSPVHDEHESPQSKLHSPADSNTYPAASAAVDDGENSDEEGKDQISDVNQSRSNSKSTSRNGGVPEPARDNSRDEAEAGTPLENESSKPLFSEDDTQEKEPIPPAEPLEQGDEMASHRTPSENLREGSPSSLKPRETVATPDLKKQDVLETLKPEAAPSGEADHAEPLDAASHMHEPESPEKEPLRLNITNKELPSTDSCEGAPDSQTLVTRTTSQDDTKSPDAAKSPEVPAKPSIPPRPPRRPQQAPSIDTSSKPTISPTEKRPPPTVPGRPKPQMPARPAKPPSRGSSESLTMMTSAGSENGGEENKDTPVSTKEKPPVPARPGGSRIAALKAGFLSDLNSRLQVGPQGPKPGEKKKEEEAPKEKVPLSDKRKGRARGPARRKPANETVAPKQPSAPEVRITGTWSLWQIDEDGDLVVGGADKPKEAEPAAPKLPLSGEPSMTPEIVKDAAPESEDPKTTLERNESQLSDIVEPTEPEPSKLDKPISSESTEAVDAPLGPKESPSPTSSLPDEKAQAGLTTESVTEPVARPDVEELPRTEVSDPELELTSSTAQNLDETIEEVAAPGDERSSDVDIHSPERVPLEGVDLPRKAEEAM